MQQNTTQNIDSSIDQVAAIKANDDKALNQLYQENYGKVERFILMNSGTKEHAKDIYQEAFIAVWRNIQLERFYPNSETALSGYLFQIAKNKWIDYLRSNHHKKMKVISQPIEATTEDVAHHEDDQYVEKVKKHFQDLGENCKEVLISFYYRRESMRTIAARFNWTEATAKNNKYRCLQKLRQLLNNHP